MRFESASIRRRIVLKASCQLQSFYLMGKQTIEVTQLKKSGAQFAPARIGKIETMAPSPEVGGRSNTGSSYAQCPFCGFVGVIQQSPGEPYHAYSCQNCSQTSVA